MWSRPENDQFANEIYLAGEYVSAGTYKQIGSQREIKIQREDYLPASLDGRVACYVRLDHAWGDKIGPSAAPRQAEAVAA
jgi:hypothetical protein